MMLVEVKVEASGSVHPQHSSGHRTFRSHAPLVSTPIAIEVSPNFSISIR